MLDLAGKPPAPPKPEIDLKSINQPSQVNEALAGVMIVSLALMTAAVFFAGRAQAKKLSQLDAEQAALTSAIQAGPLAQTASKAAQVAEALQVLQAGPKGGVAWLGLFQTLQGVSTMGIRLSSLSVDTKNVLKLEGSSDSYVLLAHYLATLRTATALKRIDLLSASLVETLAGQRVTFVIQIEIDPTKVVTSETNGGGN